MLDWPSDDVWAVVRDFNNYPAYFNGVTESHIEDDRAGDAVGGGRNFVYRRRRVRQRLLAHSDVERSFSYGSCETFSFPTSAHEEKSIEVIDYEGTLWVNPVVETGRASRQISSDAMPKGLIPTSGAHRSVRVRYAD